MMTLLKSPLIRISIGLVLLTISILMLTEFLGFIPDTKKTELKSRKIIAESLAVQLSSGLSKKDIQSVQETIRSVVERNPDILSAAVRLGSDELMMSFGGHADKWKLKTENKSTPSQVQVPLYNDVGRWATFELKFSELEYNSNFLSLNNTFMKMLLFMSLLGFASYFLFLKRALRELNPDDVIPERVRKALDTFAEGLLIVDIKGIIVFSNAAFADRLGFQSEDLAGRDCADLGWEDDGFSSGCGKYPWSCVLEGDAVSQGVRLRLKTALEELFTFDVNATPILSTAGAVQGVMITFDDITEIENKNNELTRVLSRLENSQEEITRQNQELQVLATRDPLTGVLNRRAFFHGFEALYNEAKTEGSDLCCIMLDIDHFKSVNDKYGHATGDRVIIWLANILTRFSRADDLVGRYGGEEFCMIMPGVGKEAGFDIAERIRQAVQGGTSDDFPAGMKITSSFGLAFITDNASSHNELVEQADWALYSSKDAGRNMVTCWTMDLNEHEKIESKSLIQHSIQDDDEEDQERLPATLKPEPSESQEVSTSLSFENDKLYEFFMHGNSETRPENSENIDNGINIAANNLPQLPGMVVLYDRIDQAIKQSRRQESHVAVMVLNMEVLRRVSDAMGLVVGEKLARVIIARLKQVLRVTDTVTLTKEDELSFSISRLGSHQVVLLLTDINETDVVTGILKRIFISQNEPVEVEGNDYYLDTNVGISMYPEDGENSDMLLRHASSAMRESMDSQDRNVFRFYADEIDQRFKENIQLEAELHKALERDELDIYYQPKVDLKSGEILGMEALLRWHHPQLHLVSPVKFIPLAEQTGLINDIGLWVIDSVCRQLKLWHEKGHEGITVAVNLSPIQFRNARLAEQIISMVDNAGIPANTLEVEITEGVIVQDVELAISTLEKLNDRGITVSLDDFGTGYSSLSYLKRFPLSKIKIDRSFVSDLVTDSGQASIVSAIIAMSHSLGLRVVAEGVETEEQLHFLQDLYCDEMQGYLVSKPVPKDKAKELLSQSIKIKHMVIKPGNKDYLSEVNLHGISPAPGMIGLLNDCPVKVAKH